MLLKKGIRTSCGLDPDDVELPDFEPTSGIKDGMPTGYEDDD